MTLAPRILANWTAMEPTPPAAPEMTTVSPAFNAPFSYPLKRCIVRAGSMSGPHAGERAGGVRITVKKTKPSGEDIMS